MSVSVKSDIAKARKLVKNLKPGDRISHRRFGPAVFTFAGRRGCSIITLDSPAPWGDRTIETANTNLVPFNTNKES